MITSHRYYGAPRLFRRNRYCARTPVMIVLMLVVWLPAASGGCLFGACDSVAGKMVDCPSCPGEEAVHPHGRHAKGDGCQIDPCPAMKAVDNNPLIDQVLQASTAIKALPAASPWSAIVQVHCANGDVFRYHDPPAQTRLYYEFCTLLM